LDVNFEWSLELIGVFLKTSEFGKMCSLLVQSFSLEKCFFDAQFIVNLNRNST
jgi:hypothetical protein